MSSTTIQTIAPARPGAVGPYDQVTRLFHWATVLLVLALYGLAQGWGFLPRGTPTRHFMQVTHVSLGLCSPR